MYVLTFEVNEYDQHGEYFLAVFSKKPSIKTLAAYFTLSPNESGYNRLNRYRYIPSLADPMSAVVFLEHLREGGGRQGTEDYWFNLTKVEPADG